MYKNCTKKVKYSSQAECPLCNIDSQTYISKPNNLSMEIQHKPQLIFSNFFFAIKKEKKFVNYTSQTP